jgi:hypothetical protein
MTDRVKFAGDALAISTLIANIMSWLPILITVVSGLLSIVWMSLRIYQTWREIMRNSKW